jgi:predicted ribosome quality control (RQC) complex YloA/Tae2 family protein
MYVDAVTTAAISDELRTTLVGGRVQATLEIDPLTIGIEIYAGKRTYLLLSADPQSARVHIVPEKLRRGTETPSPLGLLLRKYVNGARLVAVEQPPWERILHLDFSGPEGETRLVAETMEHRSNLLLTFEGQIMDCIKRVGPEENRYRVLLPGKPYTPPPPQRKVAPTDLTVSDLEDAFRAQPEAPAWQLLVDRVAGVSPLWAREIVFRASDEPEAPAFELAASCVHMVLGRMVAAFLERQWEPCIVAERAFAAYELRHLGDFQRVASMSAAMVAYFGAPVGKQAYEPGKDAVRSQLDGALRRARRKVEAMARQIEEQANVELLRKQGELVLAYASVIVPEQTELRAQYDVDGPTLTILLDPNLTALANAQRYFDRYEKAKRAAADLPRLMETAQQEVAYLEQVNVDLEMAENWPGIDAIREALQDGGYWRGPKTRGPAGGASGPRRVVAANGTVILIGRNAAQNHKLVTERSSPEDLWLHARGLPGSHVIVKSGGRHLPLEVIQQAAELAAYYSAGRGSTTVDVDVTERRYVRPIRGGKPGMVTYKNEYTLAVTPRGDKPLREEE